jgi:CheY-like chemotaxis protein
MSPQRLSGRTIIVVEDHDEARMAISNFLDHLGATVVAAKDGLEGLEAVKNKHPHLVVTDLLMPGMDGFELMREIQGLPPEAGGDTPVIAMTALDSRLERNRILTLGFCACLQKPFTAQTLVDTILYLLDR